MAQCGDLNVVYRQYCSSSNSLSSTIFFNAFIATKKIFFILKMNAIKIDELGK